MVDYYSLSADLVDTWYRSEYSPFRAYVKSRGERMTNEVRVWLDNELSRRERAAWLAGGNGAGAWEARGPYPASGDWEGRPVPLRGNLRVKLGRDDLFHWAEIPWELVPHMAINSPADVLRRIRADREQLWLHGTPDECVTCESQSPCDTLLQLAKGYGWKA